MTQKLLIALTAANLGLLGYQSVQPRPNVAATADAPPVLRGRALEIVDDRGRVRASSSVWAQRGSSAPWNVSWCATLL